MLQEGMKIKTFPDTDVQVYVQWIRSQGFSCYIVKDGIRIGNRFRPANFNSEKTGELIKNKMRAKKIKIRQVADYLMVTESTVYQWTQGGRVPRECYRHELFTLLGISFEEWEGCRDI